MTTQTIHSEEVEYQRFALGPIRAKKFEVIIIGNHQILYYSIQIKSKEEEDWTEYRSEDGLNWHQKNGLRLESGVSKGIKNRLTAVILFEKEDDED